jgi:DNA-binding response OmpR family regulator
MAKILLVDDDPLVRTSLADVLSESGHQVAEAVDGDDGLSALARESFDLVVLDILMPGREGLETIREIRKQWTTLPVLAISGGGRNRWCDFLRMATEFGANETLAKPFLSHEFVACVARLLGAPRDRTLS